MFEQLREIIATKFHLDLDEIRPESTLGDLELDSLDVVELGLIVEKELGVRVTDDEMAELGSLDDLVRMVEARLAAGRSASV